MTLESLSILQRWYYMGPQMFVVVALLCKTLVTVPTFELLDFHMHLYVKIVVPLLVKHFGTVLKSAMEHWTN